MTHLASGTGDPMPLRPGRRTADAPLAGTLLDRVQHQLAVLRDRELGRDIGRCERCRQPVSSQQSFMRHDGAVVHLRCRITHALTRPSPR